MISPDLVRVRKKNGALLLAKPSPDAALRARALAEQVLSVLVGMVNETRLVVEEALNELITSIKEVGLLQPVVVRQAGPDRCLTSWSIIITP